MCASEEGGIIERTLLNTWGHLEITGVKTRFRRDPWNIGSLWLPREAFELLQGLEWGL